MPAGLNPSAIHPTRIQAGSTSYAPNGATPGAQIGDMYLANDQCANPAGAVLSVLCSPAGNDPTVSARGRCYPTGARVFPKGPTTVQTVGAVADRVFSYNMSVAASDSTPLPGGVYTFFASVSADTSTLSAGGLAQLSFSMRWDGAALTMIGAAGGTPFQGEAAIAAATVVVSASSPSVEITVTGVAGLTINWACSCGFTTNQQ